MSYRTPPQVAFAAFNTNGAINTDTTTVVIAAPGAGKSLRIVGFVGWLNQNATGVVRLHIIDSLTSGIFYGIVIGAVGGGGNGFSYNFPEPGILLSTEAGLSVTHASSVATQPVRVNTYYYIDSVS